MSGNLPKAINARPAATYSILKSDSIACKGTRRAGATRGVVLGLHCAYDSDFMTATPSCHETCKVRLCACKLGAEAILQQALPVPTNWRGLGLLFQEHIGVHCRHSNMVIYMFDV